MKQHAVFGQTEGMTGSHGYGTFYILGGGLFLCGGVYSLWNGIREGVIMTLFALAFIGFGYSLLQSYFYRVKFMYDEILLTIGPFVKHRMPVSQVRMLCYAEVWAIFSRSPKHEKEETLMGVLVLSPQTPSHVRYMARRWVAPEVESGQYPNEEAREYAIMQSAIDAYVRSCMSNFRLGKREGIWLEYTQERYERIKKLLPNAEDFVMEYGETK